MEEGILAAAAIPEGGFDFFPASPDGAAAAQTARGSAKRHENDDLRSYFARFSADRFRAIGGERNGRPSPVIPLRIINSGRLSHG
jgi:hypothetical protein